MSLEKVSGASVYYLEGVEVHGDITSPVRGDLAIYTYAPTGGFIGQEYSYSGTVWFERAQIMKTADGSVALQSVISKGGAVEILSATGAGAGAAVITGGLYLTFQATSDASHTGTSTVGIEASNDNVGWIPIGTISVTGNSNSDGFESKAAWKYARANCTAHGDSTNAVTVTMGG